MIRKRIEITACVVAAIALMTPTLASGQSRDRSTLASPQAEAFRVRLGADQPPEPLPPSPDAGAFEDDAAFGQADVPDIPYSYFWTIEDGIAVRAADHSRREEVSDHSPGLLAAFEMPRVVTPQTRWLPAPSAETRRWSFGARNWQTRLDDGPEIRLGSGEIAVPEWNESVRLTGVSLSQSYLASTDDVSQWNYSLAFGAVDQSPSGEPGDLVFGPTAGSLGVTYDYSPNLSIASKTEVAADLLMSSVVGQYDLGTFGRWRSGVARSNQGQRQGWRYRAMADFDLADDLSLGWMGERYTDGFADIRRYASQTNAASGTRQRWSATWDTGRWGQWTGNVESAYGEQGVEARRFGLSQQFWYSPNLRIGFHAEREVVSDDYDIGLRFSFPLY